MQNFRKREREMRTVVEIKERLALKIGKEDDNWENLLSFVLFGTFLALLSAVIAAIGFLKLLIG